MKELQKILKSSTSNQTQTSNASGCSRTVAVHRPVDSTFTWLYRTQELLEIVQKFYT